MVVTTNVNIIVFTIVAHRASIHYHVTQDVRYSMHIPLTVGGSS